MFFLEQDFSLDNILRSDWIYHAIIIGTLFIIVFNFYAFGTQKVGIAVTTVANKMSLIIPVCAALILYPNEEFTSLKGIAFFLALVGIYLSSTKKGKLSFNKKYLWLIILVFVGQGISDAIFYDFAKKINIVITNKSDYIEFIIIDNGTGFSEKNLRNILKPYFTTKSKGSGLGLSIVNKIINDHEGTIKFTQQKIGAKIIVKFPKNVD